MYLIWILVIFALFEAANADTVSTKNTTQCGNMTCFNNAQCRNSTYGGLTCMCQRGYTGNDCKDDSDECRGREPCFHRGKCQNFYGGYRCLCFEGWKGEDVHCIIKDNSTKKPRECKKGWSGEWCQDECLNDTMCGPRRECFLRKTNIISQTGHRCRCIHGWMGHDCEHDRNECTVPPNPCPKDRLCLNTPGSYSCTCLSGWKGDTCTEDIDECLSNPCQHYLNCTSFNCSDNIDECKSNPCENRQTCKNTQGSYECHCREGWNGTNCDIDIDECKASVSPCLHAGTCINSNGSNSCSCTSGWSGKICNSDIDECTQNPCSDRQMCNNTPGSYICPCIQGWNGTKCDVDIDECLASPCLNAGTCVNTNGSYYCECTSGWNGTECENDIDECEENPCNGTLTCTNSLGSYTCSRGQLSVTGNNDARRTYIIVGSVLGLFLLLCGIAVFVWIWKKKKRNARRVDTSDVNGT